MPYLTSVVDTEIYLAFIRVGKHVIDKPLVECALATIICDLQHVVDSRIQAALAYLFSSIRKRGYKVLLLFAGMEDFVYKLGFGNRQIKHIRSLNVSRFFEKRDQLRQIKKAGKPCLGTVARSFGG